MFEAEKYTTQNLKELYYHDCAIKLIFNDEWKCKGSH
jgi:hypothetical protein